MQVMTVLVEMTILVEMTVKLLPSSRRKPGSSVVRCAATAFRFMQQLTLRKNRSVPDHEDFNKASNPPVAQVSLNWKTNINKNQATVAVSRTPKALHTL